MQSIGELVKEFRKARGWSYTRMAQEVSKKNGGIVSRQAITQLETVGARKPHYISALARVMGTTADRLLAGVESPAPNESLEVAPPTDSVTLLAQALSAFSASERERAAVLLQGLARDPDGPWAAWLTELLTKGKTAIPDEQQQEVRANTPDFKYIKSNQPTAPLRRKQQ